MAGELSVLHSSLPLSSPSSPAFVVLRLRSLASLLLHSLCIGLVHGLHLTLLAVL